jgi:hypothetical protein
MLVAATDYLKDLAINPELIWADRKNGLCCKWEPTYTSQCWEPPTS